MRLAFRSCIVVAASGLSGCGDDIEWPFYWSADTLDDADASGADSGGPDTLAVPSPDATEDDVTADASDDLVDERPEPELPSSDRDGDSVPDRDDPAPDDPALCGDLDFDDCDDCTVRLRSTPEDDGFDPDQDGKCELPLDPTCLHGEFAADDPLRREACELHALVNDDRRFWTEEAAGAGALRWDEDIWRAALGHSRDMCERNYFEHDSPEGLSAGDRMRASGVTMRGWGENISLYPTPLTIEYSFMAEPTCTGHRGNILAPGFTRGASALFACNNPSSEWNGYPFTTQNFVADGGLNPSPYCNDPQTACEDAPDPVSTSRQWCPLEGSRCQDVEGPAQWDCPVD